MPLLNLRLLPGLNNTDLGMKTLLTVCAVLITLLPCAVAQEGLSPLIAFAFGKQITVQAEFVPKSNDYYSQNFISEHYSLKVTAVNGKNLKEPVVIEYRLQIEAKKRARIERPGAVVTLEAYESLYQPSFATPWLGDSEQGMGFALIHVLFIRPQVKNQ